MHIVTHMTSSRVLRDDVLPDHDRCWTPQLWGILFVLGGALCLDALDVSMVGVALPSIRSALGLSTSSLQWIVSGYVLGYGGLLLLGGRAADLLGRRRVFVVALAAFALVSVLGGVVSSPGLLVAARFIKGAAAAFTAPASMSLLTTTFPEGPMRNRAFSIYTVFGASGFSLGLVLSGALTEISWRLTLLVSAPVAVVVLAAALWLIPRGERTGRGERKIRRTRRRNRHGRDAAARLHGGNRPAGGLGIGQDHRVVRRSRRPAGGVRDHRTAQPGSAGAVRHLLLGRATTGQYRGRDAVRHLYLVPVPGHAVPADLVRLVGDVDRAGVPARGRDGRDPVRPDAIAAQPVRPGAADRTRLHLPGPRLRGLPAGRCPPGLPDCHAPRHPAGGVAFGLGFSLLSVAATAGVPNAEQGLAASLFQTLFQVGGAVVLAIVTAVVDAGGARRSLRLRRRWPPTGRRWP